MDRLRVTAPATAFAEATRSRLTHVLSAAVGLLTSTALRVLLAALCVLCGAGAAVYGLWLAWEPAGWIVGGGALVAAGATVEIGERR